jgi:hypothetical protein
MVCYARPASRMAALLLVVFLVFGRPAAHFLDVTALLVAIAVAVGGAALAAAVVFVVFRAVQRRQAAAGGCVSCQLRCQHAMTEQPRRLVMVSTVNRPADRAGDPGAAAAAPRWPDRPAYRSGVASRAVVASRPTASRAVVASRPTAPRPAVDPRPAVPASRMPAVWQAGGHGDPAGQHGDQLRRPRAHDQVLVAGPRPGPFPGGAWRGLPRAAGRPEQPLAAAVAHAGDRPGPDAPRPLQP